jgi:hypothetical protein
MWCVVGMGAVYMLLKARPSLITRACLGTLKARTKRLRHWMMKGLVFLNMVYLIPGLAMGLYSSEGIGLGARVLS